MVTVADIFRRHAGDYLARYGEQALPSHLRAIDDIVGCRTPAMGGKLAILTVGRYVFRGPMTNRRIVDVTDYHVVIRYRDTKSRELRNYNRPSALA